MTRKKSNRLNGSLVWSHQRTFPPENSKIKFLHFIKFGSQRGSPKIKTILHLKLQSLIHSNSMSRFLLLTVFYNRNIWISPIISGGAPGASGGNRVFGIIIRLFISVSRKKRFKIMLIFQNWPNLWNYVSNNCLRDYDFY